MSVDKRQLARTQGKFSNDNENRERPESYRSNNNPRRSASGQEADVRKRYDTDSIPPRRRRYSDNPLSKNNSTPPRRHGMPQNGNRVRYIRSDDYKFEKLQTKHEAEEIKTSGLHVLSQTENGESRVYYYPSFLDIGKAYTVFGSLESDTDWYEKEVFVNGERYPQPRLVAWYGPLPYSYSGVTLAPREFPPEVLQIKCEVEEKLKEEGVNAEFNSVLLNLYRDNKDSVAWHSDDELTMGIYPTIASISLGEVRRFEMRQKSLRKLPKDYAEYVAHLKHGSLIVMDGVMQLDWEHRVPKEYHDKLSRINLTFRKVYSVESVKRPMGRVDVQKPIDDTTKARTAVSQEPFTYEEDNFPSLGSHHNKTQSVDIKTSQRVNQGASRFSNDWEPELRHNAEEGPKQNWHKDRSFRNRKIHTNSQSPNSNYKSGNHSFKKHAKIPPGFSRQAQSSPSPNSESVLELQKIRAVDSRSPHQKPEQFLNVTTSDASETETKSGFLAVQRLQEMSEFASKALDDVEFSERDKDEMKVWIEVAKVEHLPEKLIDILVNRMESLLSGVLDEIKN